MPKTPKPPTLAQNIRTGLKAKGLTHAQAIEKSGMAQGTFYSLLRGQLPKKIETIKQLRALDIQIPPDVAGLET